MADEAPINTAQGTDPAICENCSPWAARSQSQLDNRLRNMAASPDVAPFACPRCGSTAWATTTAFIGPSQPDPSRAEEVLRKGRAL